MLCWLSLSSPRSYPRPSVGMSGEGAACLCVSEVCDIEENIWAPRLGLKGKIDATMEVKVHTGELPLTPSILLVTIEQGVVGLCYDHGVQ